MPNEFSGQIVVEKDGFKEIHIIKDGKAIQKYNVRVYPDGREVSVDDEFAVVAVQDGQKVKACSHLISAFASLSKFNIMSIAIQTL